MIKWFINRPVSLFCVYSIIFLLGMVSLFKIPIEFYPDVEMPSITINFYLNNVSPEAMEKYVTSKIESAVYKLNGVKDVKSRSERGECSVVATFVKGTDMVYQRVLLFEAIRQLSLPEGISGPYISENIPNEINKGHTFILYISGPYSLIELGEYANMLKSNLSKINGIKDISIEGTLRPFIDIKLKSNRYRPETIADQLIRDKVTVGKAKINGREISVIFRKYKNIRNVLIDGVPLYKIATIEYLHKEPYVISKINGNRQITVNIDKQRGYNLLKIDRDIEKTLSHFNLERGMKITVARNEADEIKETIKNIFLLGLISILGVGIVLFFFFKKLYQVIIFLLSILFSVLLTFTLLYFSKLSINALTLAGLALGFGMLVDNSIIVLENIMRMKENNMNNPELNGAKDVSLAIIASTLTTISVYIPFLYFQGNLRIYYKQFALSSTFALLSSIFVALTLIPSLTRHLTPVRRKQNYYFPNIARKILKFKWGTLGISLLLFVGSIYIFDHYIVKGNIYYFGNKNELYINLKLPEGSQKSYLNEIVKKFENVIGKYDGVKNFYTTIYKNNANIYIKYKNNPDKSQIYQLKENLEKLATNFSNMSIYIIGAGEPFYLGGGGLSRGRPQLTLKGYDYYELKELAKKISRDLATNNRIQDIDPNFSWNSKQKEYILFRKNNSYGFNLTNNEIVDNLRQKILIYKDISNKTIPIEIYNDSLPTMKTILHKRINNITPVAALAGISILKTPPEIRRENHQYKIDVAYTYRGPYLMAMNFKSAFLKSIHLPEGFKMEGSDRINKEAELGKKTIIIAVVLSLFLLMAILSSLYESILKPIIILLTIPFSFIGIVLLYYLTKTSFDSSAFVGVILFSGIAVNDGIVLIDHLSKGKKQSESEIIKRTYDRVRPVLITSLTTIIALIPFLFLKSQGVMFSKLSLSTIGGLIFSTIGSLVLIPILYFIMFGKKEK